VESWSFDLLWYAYLQAAGYGYPASLIVAGRLGALSRGGRLLDLGSGAGVTAQLFAALGWEVTLADVSATLLAFARWRHERRGVQARYLHLPADLPDGAFDLITALDVLGHVPDVTETARRLHRALRPGGLLVGNFDVRPRSAANAWHLYQDDLPLRWAIQRAGFVPVRIIDGAMWVYRAEPAGGAAARLHAALAWARLASPPVRVSRKTMRLLARAALRARQADRGSEPLTGLK
jgi:SAM-dependent methyltransferase